jgi:hypothetical protein
LNKFGAIEAIGQSPRFEICHTLDTPSPVMPFVRLVLFWLSGVFSDADARACEGGEKNHGWSELLKADFFGSGGGFWLKGNL